MVHSKQMIQEEEHSGNLVLILTDMAYYQAGRV